MRNLALWLAMLDASKPPIDFEESTPFSQLHVLRVRESEIESGYLQRYHVAEPEWFFAPASFYNLSPEEMMEALFPNFLSDMRLICNVAESTSPA